MIEGGDNLHCDVKSELRKGSAAGGWRVEVGEVKGELTVAEDDWLFLTGIFVGGGESAGRGRLD